MSDWRNAVAGELLVPSEDGLLLFACPGCGGGHWLDQRWTVSGTPARPTASPSVKVDRLPHGPVKGQGVCHLFLRDGHIQYLNDSTHHLAGKTVPMEPL